MPKANKALMEPKSRTDKTGKEGRRKMPDSLRQRMAQAVVGTGPSVVPPGIGPNSKEVAPPPPPKKDERPDIRELLGEGEDRDTLRQLINQQAYLNGQKKSLELQLEPIEDRIKNMLGTYGIGSMVCDGNNVSYFPSGRSTISATMLLAEGISQEIISKCTKTSESKTLVIKPQPQSL